MSELDPPASAPTVATSALIPTAKLRPERRFSLAWLIPLLVILLAGWLGWRAWTERGLAIKIQLDQGHGLKPGDEVRYRGIGVGRVETIELGDDLRTVLVTARLTSQAEKIARIGTRFWVVRPRVRLTEVEGLETLLGPRYLAALPAHDELNARPQRQFVAVTEPPVIESIAAGDLEIILQATQRGSLHAGAPVSYRQTRVGTVLSVGLAGDGGSVEARAHIQKAFVPLVRPATRFWDVGGLQAKLGITGVSIEIDSAESLIAGGVALATPPEAGSGEIVRTGHRFILAPEPDKDWLEWQPMIALGSSLLPVSVSPPAPLRATMAWKQDRFGGLVTRPYSTSGWVLQLPDGVLGPTNLLIPTDKAEAGSVVLEVAGTAVELNQPAMWERNGLAMIKAEVSTVKWPKERVRRITQAEDCLAIADNAAAPLPLEASRLRLEGTMLRVDAAMSVDASWHGAAVVARSDGRLLGILLVEREEARVVAINN